MTSPKRLLPTPIPVEINGETIDILPFPFGQLHVVTAKLSPLIAAVQGLANGAAISYDQILVIGGEGLQEVLAMAANKPRDWLNTFYGEAGYEEGKALAEAVWTANQDLFLKKIIPDLMNLMATGGVAAGKAKPKKKA